MQASPCVLCCEVWGRLTLLKHLFRSLCHQCRRKSPRAYEGRSPRNPSKDLNICHQWQGQGTQAHNLPIWQHISIFTTFEKQSMINRLSNPINRNRSAAKISQVLCSAILENCQKNLSGKGGVPPNSVKEEIR